MFLLDTSMCSAIMRRDPHLHQTPETLPDADSARMCTITRGEILFGIEQLPHGRRRSAFEAEAQRLFGLVPCEPVPPGAGEHYAQLKLDARRRGVAISENDFWIAATAVALDATLVAADRDHSRLSGLRLEDWTREDAGSG